jgi:amino acid transporter
MSAVDTTSSEAPQRLAKDSIGLGRVIAFTAAFMGPAASIALGLVAAISFAGFATPFVVLLSFIGALLASNSVAQLSRKLPSAGSLFTYNASVLGPKAGFVSGWLMVFAYILWVPSGIGAVGTFTSAFLNDAFSLSVNENVLLVIVLAIVALLAFRGIATSTAVDVIVLIIEVGVIAALAATILIKGGPGPSGLHLFDPGNTLNGKFSDITLGMVYTVVIFSGFESGAVLGEETRNPRRNVPRGIFGAVILVGVFYLFTSYAELHGVAPDQIGAFTENPSQLGFLTEIFWSPSLLWLIDLVVALSTLGFVIAAFNAAVRLAFAMGRERMLPSSFAKLSRFDTPTYAVIAITAIALIIGLPVAISQGGFLAFAYIGALSGISLIILFISVSFTMIVGFLTRWRDEFNPITHLLFPIAAIVIFGIPLVGTFYPRPEPPFSWLPFLAIAWLAIGIVVAFWLARNRAEMLSRIGRVFVDEGPEQPYPSAVPPQTVIPPEDRGGIAR